MNNHPPNHPLYNTLGNPTNIHLLDSMFSMPTPEQSVHKPTLIPAQYAYQDMQALSHPHHAMNLAQSHVVTTAAPATTSVSLSEIAVAPQVLIYQEPTDPQHQQQQQQQQQPISYKIPQMETASAANVAVTIPASSIVSHQTLGVQVVQTTAGAAVVTGAGIQTLGEKKKDIVAEAASKIFEDIGGKKPDQIVASAAASLPTAVKSEPVLASSGPSTGVVTDPSVSAASNVKTEVSGASTSKPAGSSAAKTPVPVRAQAGRPRTVTRPMHRQQLLPPRLQLLDDEDDGVTCRMCLQAFWYKNQLLEHLKTNHSITDPDRYEREEREKKLRRRREEQQRHIMAKRQRMAAAQGRLGRGAASRLGKVAIPGPRPSFQYREGAFICDLCKKSFSDGNDMVSHWKLHVKKQRQLDAARAATEEGGSRGRGRSDYSPPRRGRGRGRGRGYRSSRGRPISGSSAGRGRGRGRGRRDKGKPRWTAYLVWSTRRRKEISIDSAGLGFAEVAKIISEEWKKVEDKEREKLQDEAELMNARGQRKLPKDREESSDDETTTDEEDPPFDEANIKPIMLKIKREDGEEEEVMEGEKRSTRKRKRPSFFQEFENEENNLDKILDEFEQEQIEESKKPKAEKKIRTPRPGGPRKRRVRTPSPDEPQEPVELERSRSGRMRKKPKFQAYFKGDEGEEEEEEISYDEEDEEDRDEYKPDESDEAEEDPEEESAGDEEELEEEEIEGELDEDGNPKKRKRIALPPKKRGPKKIMTDAEIDEATKAAKEAKSGGEFGDGNAGGEDNGEGEQTSDKVKDGGEPASQTEDGSTIENVESGDKKSEPVVEDSISTTNEAESMNVDASGMVSEVTEEDPTDAEAGASGTGQDMSVQMVVEEDDDVESVSVTKNVRVIEASVVAPVSEESPAPTSDPVPLPVSDASEEPSSNVPDTSEIPPENGSTNEDLVQSQSKENDDAPSSTAVDAAVPSEEDLLNTAVPSKMEEGDDKYKDIIAEAQLDSIFN
ncbi:protein PRRC2C-like [Tigriopus californicus]|nr:protein PRRC2C-like [Tigriopus californicus]XP_059094070.1 protein PRRC2C-like [Tigriopus californicus]|eukprot:TCALIF_05600-PA protein Name:"Protein of unknown function" AED:0.18 eAED:0.18 QI:183/1/1/1/0.66/0.75/4/607/1003